MARSSGRGHVHEPPPVEALRAPGRRVTRQRRLIWEALTADPERHLSAEEIAGRTRLDTSTVYRTLAALVRRGLVRRTDLGTGRACYEPAHEHPHHHVVCTRCGAVVHLHEDDLGDLRARVERASGYLLGQSEISLAGLCPACRRAERA